MMLFNQGIKAYQLFTSALGSVPSASMSSSDAWQIDFLAVNDYNPADVGLESKYKRHASGACQRKREKWSFPCMGHLIRAFTSFRHLSPHLCLFNFASCFPFLQLFPEQIAKQYSGQCRCCLYTFENKTKVWREGARFCTLLFVSFNIWVNQTANGEYQQPCCIQSMLSVRFVLMWKHEICQHLHPLRGLKMSILGFWEHCFQLRERCPSRHSRASWPLRHDESKFNYVV